MSPPTPLQSPSPPDPGPEGDSGVRMLTKRELKAIKEAEQKLESSRRLKRYVFGAASLVVTTVIGTVGALAWGQSKIDAGVAPLDKRVTKLEAAQIQTDLHLTRTETMVEMLARERGLQPPPPVPPKPNQDGGP